MLRRFRRVSLTILLGSVFGGGVCLTLVDEAQAQSAEGEAPPAEAEEAAEAPPAPDVAEEESPPAEEEQAPPPSEPKEEGPPPGPPPPPESLIPDGEAPPQRSMPPVFPPAIPSIDYGARLRTALVFQDHEDPEGFGDVGQYLEADLYMSGQIHRYWSWLVAFHMDYGGSPSTPAVGSPAIVDVQPLDVIAKFEPMREFNIYMGRMLVQADRFTPGGPWGIDEFFYPGFFMGVAGPPALPKAGPVGRDVGTTIWGAPFGGHFKYYAGAFQLHDPALSPLYSGRLQLSLLSPEPAFFQRTTYYGTKDLISFGVGGQYQKDGTVQRLPPTADPAAVPGVDDHTVFTADANFEKNLPGTGTFSLVGEYVMMDGDYQFWDNYWVASAGYMLPQVIGIGKVRGTLRYQQAVRNIPDAGPTSLIEAQLSYLVAAWYTRIGLGFRRGSTYVPGTPPSADGATPGTPESTLNGNQIYLSVVLADP